MSRYGAAIKDLMARGQFHRILHELNRNWVLGNKGDDKMLNFKREKEKVPLTRKHQTPFLPKKSSGISSVGISAFSCIILAAYIFERHQHNEGRVSDGMGHRCGAAI